MIMDIVIHEPQMLPKQIIALALLSARFALVVFAIKVALLMAAAAAEELCESRFWTPMTRRGIQPRKKPPINTTAKRVMSSWAKVGGGTPAEASSFAGAAGWGGAAVSTSRAALISSL